MHNASVKPAEQLSAKCVFILCRDIIFGGKMYLDSKRKRSMAKVYSAAHFIVDFSSAFHMFRCVAGSNDWYTYILLYNFCAFAMQMPFGILADRVKKNREIAILGCGLIVLAYSLSIFQSPSVIVVGLGNALFHLGGGIDVLYVSDKNPAWLGIFVSPGALGVYLGTMLGKGNSFPIWPVCLALFSTIALIFFICRAPCPIPENTHDRTLAGSGRRNASPRIVAASLTRKTLPRVAVEASPSCNNTSASPVLRTSPLCDASPLAVSANPSRNASPRIFAAVACLFAVVCLRSYVGLSQDFSWKGDGAWGVALVGAAVFGKAFGGAAANKIGLIKTSVLSLGIAAPLFLFAHMPAAGVPAVLLFNMTMPITLWAVAKTLPGAEGFSFGLLTFALFLGFLPVHLGASLPPDAYPLFAAGAAISLALIWIGLRVAGSVADMTVSKKHNGVCYAGGACHGGGMCYTGDVSHTGGACHAGGVSHTGGDDE